MSINPYLYFDGQCRDAFDLYKSVFKSDYQSFQTFKDAPKEYNFGDDEAHKIMHVSLPIGDTLLMGADMASSFGHPPSPSNSFALSHSPVDKADADRIYKALSAGGGEEMMAMQETFWGSYFGMVKDPFGVQWLVNLQMSDQNPT